ncbi:hypothetical protein EC988_004877, partial [Linderina pennispora]
QESLVRERQRADRLKKTYEKQLATANATANSDAAQRKATSTAADASPFRVRAGTATTTSETLTLRAPSELSGGDDHMSLSTARFSHAATAIGSRYDAMSKTELIGLVEVLETENSRLHASVSSMEKELSRMRAETKSYEEQRDTMLGTIRNLQREEVRASANPIEIDELQHRNQILEEECDGLREKCSALERQLEDVQREISADVKEMFRDGDSDTDEFMDAEGSGMETEEGGGQRRSADFRGIGAAQKAQISQLELENRHLRTNADLLEQQVLDLQQKLKSESSRFYQLSHEYLRPVLREITVDAAQAERADAYVRQWGTQSNAGLAADYQHDAPSKRSKSQGMLCSYETIDSSQSSMLDHDALAGLDLSKISSYDEFNGAESVDSLQEPLRPAPSGRTDGAASRSSELEWRNSIKSFASGM